MAVTRAFAPGDDRAGQGVDRQREQHRWSRHVSLSSAPTTPRSTAVEALSDAMRVSCTLFGVQSGPLVEPGPTFSSEFSERAFTSLPQGNAAVRFAPCPNHWLAGFGRLPTASRSVPSTSLAPSAGRWPATARARGTSPLRFSCPRARASSLSSRRAWFRDALFRAATSGFAGRDRRCSRGRRRSSCRVTRRQGQPRRPRGCEPDGARASEVR